MRSTHSNSVTLVTSFLNCYVICYLSPSSISLSRPLSTLSLSLSLSVALPPRVCFTSLPEAQAALFFSFFFPLFTHKLIDSLSARLLSLSLSLSLQTALHLPLVLYKYSSGMGERERLLRESEFHRWNWLVHLCCSFICSVSRTSLLEVKCTSFLFSLLLFYHPTACEWEEKNPSPKLKALFTLPDECTFGDSLLSLSLSLSLWLSLSLYFSTCSAKEELLDIDDNAHSCTLLCWTHLHTHTHTHTFRLDISLFTFPFDWWTRHIETNKNTSQWLTECTRFDCPSLSPSLSQQNVFIDESASDFNFASGSERNLICERICDRRKRERGERRERDKKEKKRVQVLLKIQRMQFMSSGRVEMRRMFSLYEKTNGWMCTVDGDEPDVR